MADAATDPWEDLSRRMADLQALQAAVSVLAWDQETYMPPRGAAARGAQVAALQAVVHGKLVSPALGDALAACAGERDPDRAAAVRALAHDRARAAAVPERLVRALAEAQSASLPAWRGARERADFAAFAPHLEGLLAIRREMAACWLPALDRAAGEAPPEPYDALLEGNEEGMRVSRLAPILERIAGWCAPLVQRIAGAPAPDDGFLRRRFDPDAQWALSLELLEAVGFDLEAGRQDRSVHPFSQGIDRRDVRLTTRILEDQPLPCFYGTLHEAGHGLYEQGLPAELSGSVLCAAPSMGIHESQSRLWENLVGRSRPFWEAFLPRMARRFPAQLAGVTPERMYAAVNRVERTPIRVESDEVTYNLHVVLRFQLELALLRGDLAVRDLPAAWNDRMVALLGLRPRDDAEGVLQDIHWAWGDLGYFPTYTLGNCYAATLFAALRRARPALDDELRRGDLSGVLGWLRANVHAAGRRLSAEEIVRRATGTGLDDADLRAYLERKYGELYRLA
jgi:carboxypeptidase Taq